MLIATNILNRLGCKSEPVLMSFLIDSVVFAPQTGFGQYLVPALPLWPVITLGGVLRDGGHGGGRIQSPVQVSPELLLVLGVDQLVHTLVHDVRL